LNYILSGKNDNIIDKVNLDCSITEAKLFFLKRKNIDEGGSIPPLGTNELVLFVI
jgi:hypothetical protein